MCSILKVITTLVYMYSHLLLLVWADSEGCSIYASLPPVPGWFVWVWVHAAYTLTLLGTVRTLGLLDYGKSCLLVLCVLCLLCMLACLDWGCCCSFQEIHSNVLYCIPLRSTGG